MHLTRRRFGTVSVTTWLLLASFAPVAGVAGPNSSWPSRALDGGRALDGATQSLTPRHPTAITELRRVATNVQLNRDGTTRLVRLSKLGVTDESLQHLKQMPQLDYLAIVVPQVTDAGIAHIAGLANLDTLLLSGTGVTDDGLQHLAKLQKLERLYLDDTQITDAGLQHLTGLVHLKTLSLQRTKVGDAGLSHLKTLAQLETLYLNGTEVPKAGAPFCVRGISLAEGLAVETANRREKLLKTAGHTFRNDETTGTRHSRQTAARLLFADDDLGQSTH